MTIEFRNNLRNGSLAGTTKPLGLWGEDSEYGIMKKVLLGSMGHFNWAGEENLEFSSICRTADREGSSFDRNLATRQHGQLADAYQSAGVEVFMLEPNQHTSY